MLDYGRTMGRTAVQITFLETLGGVLNSALTGDSIVVLGDFKAHEGNGMIGRNSIPKLDFLESLPKGLNV